MFDIDEILANGKPFQLPRLIRERDEKGRFNGCQYERVSPLPEQTEVPGQKGQTTKTEASATAEK
ncbi:MAG: hypothetical protein IT365_28200 [Candidatus Hydrogenedentes bacterium]|nr:hypothetical protein [Candidatus Hydrogenedentota bacterium]